MLPFFLNIFLLFQISFRIICIIAKTKLKWVTSVRFSQQEKMKTNDMLCFIFFFPGLKISLNLILWKDLFSLYERLKENKKKHKKLMKNEIFIWFIFFQKIVSQVLDQHVLSVYEKKRLIKNYVIKSEMIYLLILNFLLVFQLYVSSWYNYINNLFHMIF